MRGMKSSIMTIDIPAEIRKRQDTIGKLTNEISALETVALIVGIGESVGVSTENVGEVFMRETIASSVDGVNRNTERKKSGESKYPKPIGDATVELLREAGEQGLHLAEIHRRLSEMNITPNISSLDAALRKDHRKRFKLVGVRTYGLAD